MRNSTLIVDRLARALSHEDEDLAISDLAAEAMRRLLAGLPAEHAAIVERRLTRMAQAAEELGPDADVKDIAARARAIRDS